VNNLFVVKEFKDP